MKAHKSELSALYDGELAGDEAQSLIAAVVREDELQAAWRDYVLIGEVMRGEKVREVALTARVMAQLRTEPVMLAPRRMTRADRNHPWLALAASLAGVAVVGWLALTGDESPSSRDRLLAAVSPAPTFARLPPVVAAKPPAAVSRPPEVAVVVSPAERGELSEFLVAHHIQASTFRLHDSTEHIRTVTYANPDSRP